MSTILARLPKLTIPGYRIESLPLVGEFVVGQRYVIFDLLDDCWVTNCLCGPLILDIVRENSFCRCDNRLYFRLVPVLPKRVVFTECLDANGFPINRPPKQGEWYLSHNRFCLAWRDFEYPEAIYIRTSGD